MKVTVSFSDTKVVVPCGDGRMLIRELAEMAILRYRKSILSSISAMENAKGRSNSPTTDEDTTLRLHKCSSSTSSALVGPAAAYQGEFTHAVGEVGAMALRKRNPTALILTMEALTLARDGGILDWDDQVSDVLDDRELLLAKYKWDAPTSKPGTGSTYQSRVKLPPSMEQGFPPAEWQRPTTTNTSTTTSHPSVLIGAPCNGDLLDCPAAADAAAAAAEAVAGTSLMHSSHHPLHCQSSPDLGCRPIFTAVSLQSTQISSPSRRKRTPSPVKHLPCPGTDTVSSIASSPVFNTADNESSRNHPHLLLLLDTQTSSPPPKRNTSCTAPTISHTSSSATSSFEIYSSCCNSNPPQGPTFQHLSASASSTLPRQPAPALPLHRRLASTLPCPASSTLVPLTPSTCAPNDVHHAVLAPALTSTSSIDERLLDRTERSPLTTGTLRRPAPPPPTHSIVAAPVMSNRHSPSSPLPPSPTPPPTPAPTPPPISNESITMASAPLIAMASMAATTTFSVQQHNRSTVNGGLEIASLNLGDSVLPSLLVTSFKPSHSVTQPEERNSPFSRHRLGPPEDSSVLSQIPEEDGDSTSAYGGGGTGTCSGAGDFDSSTLESPHQGVVTSSPSNAAPQLPPPPTHSSPGGSSMSATSTTLPLSSSQPTASSRTHSSSPLLSSSFAGSSSDGEGVEEEEEEEGDESGGLLDSISESGTAPVSVSFPVNSGCAFLKRYHRKPSLQKYLRRSDHKIEPLVCMERIKAASERSHKLTRRRIARSKLRPEVIVMKPPKRKPHTTPSPTHLAKQEAATTITWSTVAAPQQSPLVRVRSTTEVHSGTPAASGQQSLAASSSTPVQLSDQGSSTPPSHPFEGVKYTPMPTDYSGEVMSKDTKDASSQETQCIWQLRQPLAATRSNLASELKSQGHKESSPPPRQKPPPPPATTTTASAAPGSGAPTAAVASTVAATVPPSQVVTSGKSRPPPPPEVQISTSRPSASSVITTVPPSTMAMPIAPVSVPRASVESTLLHAQLPPPPPKRSPQTVLTVKTDEKTPVECEKPSMQKEDIKQPPPPSLPPPPPPPVTTTAPAARFTVGVCATARSTTESSTLAAPTATTSSGPPAGGSGRLITAADEAEVLHMTDLLARRRASLTHREFMLSTVELEHDRERQLQAAAVNVVSFRRRCPPPAIKSHPLFEVYAGRTGGSTCLKDDLLPATGTVSIFPANAVRRVVPAEQEITIKLLKATSGLGFSLTTREMFLGAYTTAETSGGGCSGGGGGVGDSPGGRTNAMAGQSEGGEQLQRKPTQQHTQEQQTQKFTPIYGRAVCVKSIIPGGAALKDGTLRLGDRLMKVDREDVSTKSQAQIVSLLRVKPVGSEVELIVRRPCQPTTEDIAMVSVDPQRGFTVNADSSPLYEGYRSIGGANVLGCHCPSPNCAIRFPDYTRQVQQLGSCRLGSLDDSHLSDYPERFEKVIYLKLDIPLLQTAPLLSTQESSTTTATGTVTVSSPGLSGGGIPAGNTNTSGTVRSRLATMRLGVSVREGGVTGAFENSNWMLQGKQHVVGSAIVSEAGRIHQPPSAPRQQQSLIDPSGNSLSWGSSSVGLMSSTASGVFVKGIIEGGAAHADGRLRVGDELLEVNGISLLNTGNPLAVLRAVLKQATQAASSVAKVGAASAGTTRASSGDRTAPTLSLSRQEREEDETTFAASTPIPVIRLLVARRIRHRRSASGHTIGSNLGTEPLHSELPFDPRGEVDRLAEQYGGQLSTDSPNAPSCAVRIFANVHPLAAVATTSPCEAELPGPHRRPQVQGRESPRLGEEGRKQTAGPGVINKRPAPLLPKRPNTTTISNESAGLLPLTEAQKPAPSMQPPDERP